MISIGRADSFYGIQFCSSFLAILQICDLWFVCINVGMQPLGPRTHRVLAQNSTRQRIATGRIVAAVRAALDLFRDQPSEVSLTLVDDAEIARLNQEFRQIAAATDVLSFPSDGIPDWLLGDVVISVETAQRQASLHQTDLLNELQILAIHGTLHLLGLDDESDADRTHMIAEMARVAASCGITFTSDWSSNYSEATVG